MRRATPALRRTSAVSYSAPLNGVKTAVAGRESQVYRSPGNSQSMSGTVGEHAASDQSSPFVLNIRNCTYHAPKATRAGRVLFAALVAFGAWYVQFRMFRTNGLLWSLAACSPTVPLIDWLLPGERYTWLSRPATAVFTPFKGAEYETADVRRSAGVARRMVDAYSPWLLRLLRRQGRHETLQQGLAGRAGS